MILSEQHIDYISNQLQLYGVHSSSLKDDLLDHICTLIENSSHTNFQNAYDDVISKFGGVFAFKHIQEETNYLIRLKKVILEKKLFYILGFITSFLISTGIMFKIFKWPYAGMILFSGFIILNFCFLPLLFLNRYKITTQKLNKTHIL